MSPTAVVMLGVIAAATLVMALIQVALVVVGLRAARQVQGLAARVEQEMRPLIASATATAVTAARASELALVQVERVDVAVADMTRRLDEAGRLVRGAVLAPAREGRALLAGIGAALGVIREARRMPPGESGPGDEDPLFIG